MADTIAPPASRDSPTSPPIERGPWWKGIAPAYLGLFSLIVYYDQLAEGTLPTAGVGIVVIGAAVASLLCFGLLYYAPAMWGMKTGRPLMVVATSTFGEAGAPWVPGVLIGLAHVVWFAVAIAFAADLGLRALVLGRLIDLSALGPAYMANDRENPLFLFVTLAWTLSAATLGILMMRVVAAVTRGFAIVPMVVLVSLLIHALSGRGHVAGWRLGYAPWTGFALIVQMIFGFFATFGAMAADWGAASRDERDVRLGGLVGVALGGFVFATVPLLIVGGLVVVGRGGILWTYTGPARFFVSPLTFSRVLERSVGGWLGCATLLSFGLPLLGPTCYAPTLFSQRFADVGPRFSKWTWSIIGSLLAWPLVATGLAFRLEWIVSLLGALMAPVVGALAADYVRSRGSWPGPRRGVNLAGCLAWGSGSAVGLVPLIGPALGWSRWGGFQPAALFAFIAAFAAYVVLARLGLESPTISTPAPVDPVVPTS